MTLDKLLFGEIFKQSAPFSVSELLPSLRVISS